MFVCFMLRHIVIYTWSSYMERYNKLMTRKLQAVTESYSISLLVSKSKVGILCELFFIY